ncbi:MAG: hypothetical protein A3F92_11170 [Candidatus Rokubacteria bacterium RIFCSPLOWO2_12_FULL_71_22]|nr:MAG: hypothetical protein A3F92_11170 [Candidatus Rokubacteria bacterium RIFCSPLOWO2_12_FULL_71_22]
MTSHHRLQRRRAPLAFRAIEAAGRALATLGLAIPPLDEQELCAAACRKTRLSDFGDERFRPLFRQRLLDLQNLPERLAVLGRLVARFYFLRALSNRLLIEQQIKEHPEILRVAVPRPLVIAGLARTGTTLLLNLLAQDPGSRSLLLGEGLAPAVPRPGRGGADPRFRRAARLVWLANRLVPQLRSIYIVDGDVSVECGMLFRNTFLPHDGMVRDVQQWRDQFSPETWEWAYREYHRQLQLLQWQRPASDHWLLKWPQHLSSLDILVKTVPDVAIVQTHRNLAHVVPATCQMIGRFSFFLSGERWERMPQHVLAMTTEILRRSVEARQRIPSGRVFDVNYDRLVADPIGVLRDLYDHFGYRYTDQYAARVQAWLEQHPPPRREERYYDLEQFGLDRTSFEEAFAFYYQRFGLDSGT